MTTSENAALLQRYVQESAEDAFAELVRRHVHLVYSAALRQLNGDAHAAADVSQLVFAEMARLSPRLVRHPSLSGWLYTTTRRTALQRIRTETRRVQREQKAHAMQELLRESNEDGPLPNWNQVGPVLDEAMDALGKTDRHAILARFFEKRSMASVGEQLGLNENAARMRVARALEKLRGQLEKRGVVSTAGALAACLPECAVAMAPAGLAPSIISITPAAFGTATIGSAITLAFMSSKLKIALAALLALAALTWGLLQHRTIERLTAENQALREQSQQAASPAQPPSPGTKTIADADRLELARLRGEVARLRMVPAKAQNLAREPVSTGAPSTNPAPVSIDFETRAQIPFGQTLVTAAWPLVSGKRLLVFLVPAQEFSTSGDPSIVLRPTTVLIPEEMMTEHGLHTLQTTDTQTPNQLLFSTKEAKELIQTLTGLKGVQVLAGGNISSAPGIASSINTTLDDSSETLGFEFAPQMGADGQSVDLQFRTKFGPADAGKKP